MTYKVKASMPVNGPGWGLDFKQGIAFTERDDLARRLRSLGYEVEEVGAAAAKIADTPIESATAEKEADKPFFCTVCGRPFGNQASLTKHINKMHG